MQDLLYRSGSLNDLTMKTYYINSYPAPVAKAAYDKIAVAAISLNDMNLASIHQIIDGVINDACMQRS